MGNRRKLTYNVASQIELNLSYMPFIKNGGLFIPTDDTFTIDEDIDVDLCIQGTIHIRDIVGKVVWITPKNAMYQIYPGIGIQFVGEDAKAVNDQINANLDNTMDVGGYAYGLNEPVAQHSTSTDANEDK